MKNIKKLSLLLGLVPVLLTSCENFEKKAFCLETSNEPDYVEGTCYQVSPSDILETIHLINPAIEKDDKGNAKYDIEWKYNVPLSYFSFTEGLEGKKIKSIITLGENVIRLIVYGNVSDPNATSGYIKVSKEAFKAKTERVRDAYLYAYIAIGEPYGQVAKPVSNN